MSGLESIPAVHPQGSFEYFLRYFFSPDLVVLQPSLSIVPMHLANE